MSNHIGDNNKKYRHPFLAIGIAKNKVVALQFSSVKYDEENNCESKLSNEEEFTPVFFCTYFSN